MSAERDSDGRLLLWKRSHVWRGSSLLVTLVILLVAVVGTGGAVTVREVDVPNEAQVGEGISATFALGNLYQNPSYSEWTLQGTTELQDVTWTFEFRDGEGNVIRRTSLSGSHFSVTLNIESEVAELRVKVIGSVPPRSSPSISLAEFRHAREGGDIIELGSWHVTHSSPGTPTAMRTPTPRLGTPTSTLTAAKPSTAQSTQQVTTPGAPLQTEQFYRGFFTNNPAPNSSWTFLEGPQITAIGIALSIIGMVFQLRRGG